MCCFCFVIGNYNRVFFFNGMREWGYYKKTKNYFFNRKLKNEIANLIDIFRKSFS